MALVVEGSTEDVEGILEEDGGGISRKVEEIGLPELEQTNNGRIPSTLSILRMMLEVVVVLIGLEGNETGLFQVSDQMLLVRKTLKANNGTNKETHRLEQPKEHLRLKDQEIAREKLNGVLRVQPLEPATWMWIIVEEIRIGQEETENGAIKVRPLARHLLSLEGMEVASLIGKNKKGIGVLEVVTLTKEEYQTRRQPCLRGHQRSCLRHCPTKNVQLPVLLHTVKMAAI